MLKPLREEKNKSPPTPRKETHSKEKKNFILGKFFETAKRGGGGQVSLF